MNQDSRPPVLPQGVLASLRSMRFDLGEASGALGDLGTFIPIVASLIAVCRLDAGSVLLFAGLANVLTGIAFGQPVPVQPMKAIAAVAIAESLSPGSIAAAGLATGAVVLVLGLTGLVETIDRLVPRPVVRGIQLGVGLKLLVKGIDLIRQTQPLALDGWLTAAAGAGVVLLASRRPRFPSALVLFAAGIAVMAAVRPELLGHLPAGWNGLHLVIPSAAEWETGIVRGAVPQLPLTLLNSVIAVCALSEDLYPGRGAGTRKMAASVGLMNVLGCWLGAMPMCHGAGGLAGQHRFGARTGGAVVMLGIAKMAVGVAFGASAGLLLAAYPLSILGVLLAFAGIELALPARECRGREPFFVAVLTAGGCLGFNTAVGVLLGLGAAALMRARTSAGKPVV